MGELPYEIKLTYLIAIIVMMTFVGFIIIVIVVYNKKQLLLFKEKQLQESVHQNQLLQKELERQKSLEQERERISKDMHDDLGAGISSIKLQGEYILHNFNLEPSLKNEVNELINTTSEITASMREMIWCLKMQNDNLQSFINYIKNYTHQFLSKTAIEYSFETNLESDKMLISNEIRRNLFLCTKESLNNIYKHSRATSVKITFSLENSTLKLIIADNGIGIPYSNSFSGNGLKNIKIRLEEIKGTFTILEKEKGTHLFFSCTL
jgi:two-component system, NarL family, sensor histidine kinase DesK